MGRVEEVEEVSDYPAQQPEPQFVVGRGQHQLRKGLQPIKCCTACCANSVRYHCEGEKNHPQQCIAHDIESYPKLYETHNFLDEYMLYEDAIIIIIITSYTENRF